MLSPTKSLVLLALSAAAVSAETRMKAVRSIQARVQGDAPVWDEEHQVFVSLFGDTFEDKYRGSLDTVNTASVEGALMYVQAEGINQYEQSVKCERKNKMQYIVFYEVVVVQTSSALAKYSQASKDPTEYCPFVALDGGMCTPEGPNKLPKVCEEMLGTNGQPSIGPCVGAGPRSTDPRAPYPDNVWFSFPNSCLSKMWKDKTDECRTKQPGGLCPFGVKPDGVQCTFAYSILGYVSIDDVVGITRIRTKKDPNVTYRSFADFCNDGNVEFKAKNNVLEQSLPFWRDPYNPETNVKRYTRMVKTYNLRLKQHMRPLPTVQQLTASNPPCYQNSPVCATAQFGCRRKLYSQMCEECSTQGEGCVTAKSGFTPLPMNPAPVVKRRAEDPNTGTIAVARASNPEAAKEELDVSEDSSQSAEIDPDVGAQKETQKVSFDFSDLNKGDNVSTDLHAGNATAPGNGTSSSSAANAATGGFMVVIIASTFVAAWM